MSLQAFLRYKNPEFSLRKIRSLLEEKRCLIGGRVELFSSRRLAQGDRVEVETAPSSSRFLVCAVVEEDDDFMVLDKPAGVVCDPSLYPQAHLVHRLDRDTSGLWLVAKHLQAKKWAEDLFAQRHVEKVYLALVEGIFAKKEGKVENYLGKVGACQGQTLYGSVSQEQGKKAITLWRVVAQAKQSSLLACQPWTGRTHQIRVHLSGLGHPIIGDAQYARGKSKYIGIGRRHFLHAWRLSFIHPRTKQRVQWQVDPPQDFVQAATALQIPLDLAKE